RYVLAGTIPWPALEKYLSDRRDNAVDRGVAELGDGDEDKVRTLEWVIPERDYRVLQAYHPVLSDANDATLLRLYVAPQLGYAVRRLDYCTPDGRMANRFEATDFREMAPGFFMPRRYAYIRNFSDFGRTEGLYVDQFELLEAKNVNQPLPEAT